MIDMGIRSQSLGVILAFTRMLKSYGDNKPFHKLPGRL